MSPCGDAVLVKPCSVPLCITRLYPKAGRNALNLLNLLSAMRTLADWLGDLEPVPRKGPSANSAACFDKGTAPDNLWSRRADRSSGPEGFGSRARNDAAVPDGYVPRDVRRLPDRDNGSSCRTRT